MYIRIYIRICIHTCMHTYIHLHMYTGYSRSDGFQHSTAARSATSPPRARQRKDRGGHKTESNPPPCPASPSPDLWWRAGGSYPNNDVEHKIMITLICLVGPTICLVGTTIVWSVPRGAMTSWACLCACLHVCVHACMWVMPPCLHALFVFVCLPPPNTHTHTHTHTAEEATREQRAGLGRTDPQSQGGQGLHIYLSALMIRYFVGLHRWFVT